MLLACIADLLLFPAVLAVDWWTEQLPTLAAWLTANETCASALQSCTQVCNMATMKLKRFHLQRWHKAYRKSMQVADTDLELSLHFAMMRGTCGHILLNHVLTS